MRTHKVLILVALVAMFFSVNAQNLTKGSVAYYEALRISYQTKIDWVQSNPEEDAIALESDWYEMANANVQEMVQKKALAEHSPNGIYLPNQNRSINTNEPEAGGVTCDEAAPFCTDYEYDFPCATGDVPSEVGPDYGCLSSQPNAAWYFMEIENSGDIVMSLTATNDIDFIIWGPFDEVTCDYGDLSSANIVDCSYSSTNDEDPEIGPNSSGGATSATSGEFYIFVVTNFSDQVQDFSITQTSGDGTTDCSALECLLIEPTLTVELGDCEPHQDGDTYYSEYDISGCIDMNPTPSGQINDSVQFFHDDVLFYTQFPPISSPVCYEGDNFPADGNVHTISVFIYYHDESGDIDTCDVSVSYTAISNCASCAAMAGPDITVCGDQLSMNGSISPEDHNTSWTTTCDDIDIPSSTANATATFTGTFVGGEPVTCEVVWHITNYANLTCSDVATITFQPVPSAAFNLTASACEGSLVSANVPNVAGIPIVNYVWDHPLSTEETGTYDDEVELVYSDAVGSNQVCLTTTSNLGCESVPVCHNTTIKQVPNSEFHIVAPICSGGTTQLIYDENNILPIASPSTTSWIYNSSQITLTPTGDPSIWDITAENNTGTVVNYNIELQITRGGCTSLLTTSFLTVFPPGQTGCCVAPNAYAGEDATICGSEYTLNAFLHGGSNHGQWIPGPGPAVTFVPEAAQGTATEPGNRQAHIIVSGPGELNLTWKEWSGECSGEDDVKITFLAEPDITFGQENGYAVCELSAGIEAFSSVPVITDFQWFNNYTDILHIDTTFSDPIIINNHQHITFNNLNISNPQITVLNTPYNQTDPEITEPLYGNYTFMCVGTVEGQCADTAFVKVSFFEEPTCNADPGPFTPCGTLDTLHANSTYGGYWEVKTQPTGTNCSAVFSNQETGEPDIYDPNAIVSVSCEGQWVFTWHEINGLCQSECDVTINFQPNSITFNTTVPERTCLDFVQLDVDVTGFEDDTWIWSIDPNWPYVNDVEISFNPFDPVAIVERKFPSTVFGDSGYVEIPMIVTLIKGECASTQTSSVSFYQRPQPFIGRDTMVCDDQLAYNVIPTIPTDISQQQWYDIDDGGTYLASPDQAYATTISAAIGTDEFIVFSETNSLGNNHTSCLVKDSMLVAFLKTPSPSAGSDLTHVCGKSVQLDAQLDNSMNSVGRWLINAEGEGFFGFSPGMNEPEAVSEPDAWFYHSTDETIGVDTVKVVWKEFNARNPQCFATDTLPIYFWYNYEAEIFLDGSSSLEDATCGRTYADLSANIHMPTNLQSKGTWNSVDGSPIDWFKNNSADSEHEAQLDSIMVGSIGELAYVERDIYWIIQNGLINGTSQPAVCTDTSETVTIRFDNEVIADILEATDTTTIQCGNTICLSATSVKDWSHFNWTPNDYEYYNDEYVTDNADTLIQTCLIAPTNIYPTQGVNTYEEIILRAHNGECRAVDTIKVIFAPIPSGTFKIDFPKCSEDETVLYIDRNDATGIDRYIETIIWNFEEDDQPTQVIAKNETQDTISAWWGQSIENNDFEHAVSVTVKNVWGCDFTKNPPDTVYAPMPAFVEWTDEEYPTCGECDGELEFKNYSPDYDAPSEYTVEWADNIDFNNSSDNFLLPDSTMHLENLCAENYYLKVTYQADLGGVCSDTLVFNLHADSSTIATSSFEILTEENQIQVPFEVLPTTMSNTSKHAGKYTWQIFNGLEEDLSMLIYEGNTKLPDNFVFSNMGDYLIKLQAFNDKAPNCPADPYNMTIFVRFESTIEVPNIFTPNGDGINDLFKIKVREVNPSSYNCIIYNRWGQKVFESTDVEESWNGSMKNEGSSPLATGAYFYVITGTGTNGTEFDHKGAVQLMNDK